MTFHGSPPGGRRRRPLSQDEINSTGKRIGNIVGDAARIEFNDFEFNAYSDRQVDRNMDIDGNVVDNRFEKFEPSAKRQDLSLDGSLGDNADNIRREVFAVKKVMSKAGAFDFDPGNEPTTVANLRFKTAIRNFQAANDLKVDGLIRPGGPTIHMLGLKAIGQEDGKPSGYDAADFKQITGRDPNLTLTGKPIFKTLGEGGGAGSSGTQVARGIPRGGFGRGGKGSGRGGKGSGRGSKEPKIAPNVQRELKRDRSGGEPPDSPKPEIGKTPARIFRYPDGRVYISITPLGEIQRDRKTPGKVLIEEIKNQAWLEGIINSSEHPYPTWEDRRSHQEREAAGVESYVYGPVRDKDGKLSYKPLVDPSTRGRIGRSRLLRAPVGKPILLTLAQIKALGLRKWHIVDK